MKKEEQLSNKRAKLALVTSRFFDFCDTFFNKNDTELSKLLNINRQAISEMRNGKRFVSIEYVIKLAELQQDINIKWLLLGVGEKIEQNQHQKIEQNNSKILGVNISEKGTYNGLPPEFSEMIRTRDEQISRLINMLDKNK